MVVKRYDLFKQISFRSNYFYVKKSDFNYFLNFYNIIYSLILMIFVVIVSITSTISVIELKLYQNGFSFLIFQKIKI